jgi:hypothetical protein
MPRKKLGGVKLPEVLDTIVQIVSGTALVALSGGAFIFAVKIIQALVSLL